ncbi:MAG: DNA-protecting protein DprA [Rickettsiaceae bacterium]|nr:DNA-protecting protein DprA [Rickettsiaceae bacterium]
MFNLFNNNDDYSEETINILRLIRSENVGPRTFINLINLFGSASEALDNIAEFSLRGGRSKPIKVFSKTAAKQELELLHKHGAKIISYKDPLYSVLLKEIPDFPPILSYKGNISLLNSKKIVSLVGARNSSINSRSFATNLSSKLVELGYVTVSGLARGIDTSVHIASGSQTIAVIAGGIDHIYPPENKKLFEQLSEEGLIIAELPIGTHVLSKHFPQRNRIIAGLSLATIVVEAGLNSGSLITSKFALDFNREVFAVPGFPLDPRCMGSNKLIKEGRAQLLESYEDLIDNVASYDQITKSFNEESGNINKFAFAVKEFKVTNLERQKILNLLSSTPVTIEELHRDSNLPLEVLYMICLELELAGKIARHVGNKISLILEI